MAFLLRLRSMAAVALGVSAVCGVTTAHAQSRPAVIELFTSEGCNSCPPAEAYLGELAGRNDVLALSFHVDYWDDLGWRDRFALSQAVERQRTYARVLRRSTVYTPQVVIDGRDDYVGSDRGAIGKALKASRDGVPVALSVSNTEVLVRLAPREKVPRGDVLLVAYLRKAVSPIGRGENAGRTLEEYNIVRAINELGRWDGSAQNFRVKLASLPRDATDVAVLVQSPGQGPIVAAATRPIASGNLVSPSPARAY
ncbi:MAG: DUF1223 domain-containing protein [Steroidobacteraceae bacterium]